MLSLEAIGTTQQAASLRRDAKPVVRELEAKSERPAEKAEKTEKAEDTRQVKRAERQAKPAHARLQYDEETKEVFIEILDPQTGEVLQRFPAEELPEKLGAASTGVGSLVETIA